MDDVHPIALLRSLHGPLSRRAMTKSVAGLSLAGGLAARFGISTGSARKRCGPCQTRKRGKCRGRKPDGTSCGPDNVCQRGKCTPDLCTVDGIKNGAETDIDCGGSCRRCAPGKVCTGRNDCATALCTSGTCRVCAANTECGSDGNGACICIQPGDTGPFVCVTDRFTGPHPSCGSCQGGELCYISNPGEIYCYRKLCGAP